MAKDAKLDWEDLHFAKEKNGMNRYFKSKLANVLFAYELAERLKGMIECCIKFMVKP